MSCESFNEFNVNQRHLQAPVIPSSLQHHCKPLVFSVFLTFSKLHNNLQCGRRPRLIFFLRALLFPNVMSSTSLMQHFLVHTARYGAKINVALWSPPLCIKPTRSHWRGWSDGGWTATKRGSPLLWMTAHGDENRPRLYDVYGRKHSHCCHHAQARCLWNCNECWSYEVGLNNKVWEK